MAVPSEHNISEAAKVTDTAARRGIRNGPGLTSRALLLGLALSALCDLWIHWAELVLGGRGHTALANTSIPVGAFNILFLLVIVNLILTKFLKPLAFSPAELLVIFVMMTVSTVISSSGGIHFIVPTITAAFYYADSSNGWAAKFHRFIPDWIAQKNQLALHGFYVGNASVPWDAWFKQMFSWCGFLVLFSLATVCIVSLLRRQWIDRERLAFPTVAVPIALLREPATLLSSRVFQVGFALPFLIDVMNTIHLNVPTVPYFPTRTTDQPDVVTLLSAPPWNAIGQTPLSFYPFVIGIAYLLSVEMTFSCWFFWLVTKAEAVFGSAAGFTSGATSGGQSEWPFIGHQGAGAFMALTIVGLWLSRSYLKETWSIAFKKRGSDRDEPMGYRMSYIGLGICVAGLVAWCMAAGLRGVPASAMIALSFLYMIAAARIRAETGNAWLFGPEVDAYKVMTTSFGSAIYTPVDLTVLAYLRNAIGNFDLRCLSMPNQFDAYKMADAIRIDRRRLTVALTVSIVFGIVTSFGIALMVWYAYGAGAKTDSWRTWMGRMPFDQLSSTMDTPIRPDVSGMTAIAAGFFITAVLMVLRIRCNWWIFHPVGYAMANTTTMNQVWLPFFIAWLLKTAVLRYGGIRLYRLSLPFFYGLIAGDFIAGGLTTAAGCFSGINVYPTNW